MTFLKRELIVVLLLAIPLLLIAWAVFEWRFFSWVRKHWFLRRSWIHWLSSFLLALGYALLSIILLDPRAGEIKIRAKTKQARTIILIDTSTSMLAEDVRPSRLEKASLVAKHFARKAVGHQIAIMVFADITKKLVPFTSDLDLVDARLDAVKKLRNMNAGSSIGIAIEEAVQFFDPSDKSVSGNILLITDGEDTAETASFKIPDGITLAMVGVGTKTGGKIPMKDSIGMFYGNKRSEAKEVISQLNEDFFLSAIKDVKHAKFFPVQSFDLPTDEIIKFLSSSAAEESENENTIRPLALENWGIPALVALALGFALRFFKPFILLICLVSLPVYAQTPKESAKELPPEVQERLELLKKGELNREEKINLADQLVKHKMHDLAQGIYEENFVTDDIKEKPESFFNWATSEIETGKLQPSLEKFAQLEKALKDAPNREELLKNMRDNIKRAIVPPQKQQQQKPDENQDQQQSPQNDQGEGSPQEGQQGQEQKKPSQGKGDGQEEHGKNPFDTKNQSQSGDEEKPSKQGEQESKDKPSQGDGAETEEEKQAKEKRPKLSPLVEQLKEDDRKLQLKLLDTSTQKRTQRKRKDW